MAFTHFAIEIYQIYAFFADITKFSIGLESLHFPTFYLMSLMWTLSREMVMEN